MSDALDTPAPPSSGTAASFLPRITLVSAGQRFPLGGPPTIDTGGRTPSLAGEARRWSYVLRSRERWRDSAEVLALHQRDAMATLNAFGLSEAAVRSLAVAGHVVVEMPWLDESTGWAGRIFPWEFVLSRATRPYRSGGPQLTVMRHLSFEPAIVQQLGWPAGFAPEAMAQQPLAPRVMFVQSLPGALAQAYDTAEERQRVRLAFDLDERDPRWFSLEAPTLAELAQACDSFRPQVVHFSGCDTHQGLVLLRDHAGPEALVAMNQHESAVGDLLGNADAVFDGCLMRRDDGLPSIVLPPALAAALTVRGQHAPFLVGLNLWNSAARIAPLLLPAGVLASLGFQDSFDDSLAEYFFENLYGQLRTLEGNLPEAFDAAWAALRRQVDLMPGTGIALWARAPLTRPAAARAPAAPAAAPAPAPAEPGATTAPGAEAPQRPVEWVIEPKTELNYAELHNHRPLFNRFELRNPLPGSAPRVHVVVELHGGPEPARYESEIELREPRLNLQKRIQVPLTATLLRQASEAMLSTLFVQLKVDGRTVLTDTHPLRLLPVDQWRDNASSGKWLPSFVLPRDPAVERVVSAAQRYVRVIRDDPSAGFEGYQSSAPEREDTLDNVDLQVEAIWATLLHEWQLGYINPPPSYSAQLDSQRLRTPSMVHGTRVGTCIDLALLFAACLELVDIYPVIFLLDGHALPGYWRHSAFQTAFRAAGGPQAEPGAEDERLPADTARVQRAPWWTIDHDAVCKLIRAGQLAPLETVRLTEHCGFREARQAGVEALREKADFDSILDIATARAHQVTPLPIVGDRS